MLIFNDADIRREGVYLRSLDSTIPFTPDFIHAAFRQILLFLIVLTFFWARVLTGNRAKYTIGFYPIEPRPWYKIWNVTRWTGMAFSDDFRKCDILFYFEDKTKGERTDAPAEASNKKLLNAACTDISKSQVEQVFEQTFGYGLGVDPLTYEGEVVQKSEENAKHDGKIIKCPITTRESGVSYQRFVENCYDGQNVEDIRVPIVGRSIPLVYLKRRPIDIRFANDNTDCVMVETVEALSEREVEQLLDFADAMGLDFGGLDVLRDRNTGKIYVVDVNKTDMGPPVPLKTIDKIRALTRLGRAFVNMVEDFAA